jgi:serine/threonine-protein kinase
MKELEDRNRFLISREIAEGGMGSVFEVSQLGAEGFKKTMALKTIIPEFSSDPEFVEMFIGEAKLVADLVHQNIVQIYQLGKVGRQYYIAMEYIDGINLEEFMDRHMELGIEIPINMATFIISRVCRGLEYAHAKKDEAGTPLGVVHRDVSPKNVLITWEGVVKLTDFGIAKAAHFMRNREGEILLGKVQYMSPEQAAYKETDRRSDLFSLGVVMYELLSGKLLFADEDTTVTMTNVIRKPVPPIQKFNPNVPEEVARILHRALERDLEKRYQNAGEMGYDMEYFMYHDRFGPTNVTLAKYLRKLFPEGPQKKSGAARSDNLDYDPDTIIIKDEDLID